VLNVYPDDPLADSPALGAPRDETFVRLSQHTVDRACRDLPRARRVSAPARSVAAGLHAEASREGVELLVVGSSHRGAIGRALLGTHAMRAVHGAPCAVAVAPHGVAEQDWAPRSIAVAYDASDEANEALALARRIAEPSAGTVRLVTVIPTVIRGWGQYIAVPDDGAYRRAAHEQAETDMAVAHEDERREIREGSTVDVLLAVSEDVDLLIIGSRSYGPVRRVMFGSVSETVVPRSRCPVIVVPRGHHGEDDAVPTATSEMLSS